MLVIHVHDCRDDSSSQVFSIYISSVPVRPGLTRKRCVGMIIIIAVGDAGDA